MLYEVITGRFADQPVGGVHGVFRMAPAGEHALAQQVDNSMFYRGASKVADTEEGKALFAAMAAMEERHAEIVCRVLVVAVPEDLRDTGACSPAHKENLIEARKRRERVSKVYGKFLGEATRNNFV